MKASRPALTALGPHQIMLGDLPISQYRDHVHDAKAKRNCSKQNSNLPIFLFKAVENFYFYIRFCVGMIHIKEWV